MDSKKIAHIQFANQVTPAIYQNVSPDINVVKLQITIVVW